MDETTFYNFEDVVLDLLVSKLTGLMNEQDRYAAVERAAKAVNPEIEKEDLNRLAADLDNFAPVADFISNEEIEDVMINNTANIFLYHMGKGNIKSPVKVESRKELDRLVKKFKMYATTMTAKQNIYDVHLPNKSRVNIVESPIGADITIRNFRSTAVSIIDMINIGELSYNMAGRLWLYSEGLRVRPANMMIGGMPAAGKTTLINAMFSFFRPEQRIVTIEETYELSTETQENCVRLETNTDVSLEDLVQNALRMRPDLLIIGEVRGSEAKDMMTAMNIGKICMSTIHASTARDVITRLEHTPMNVERDIIPLIDAIIMVSQVNTNGKMQRRITQVAEISGIETQVLLSDLYRYDYKTNKGSDILPSVTYRDTLSSLTGVPPSKIILEEQRRGRILEQLNKVGMRGMKAINEFCREYYDNPNYAMKRIGMNETV